MKINYHVDPIALISASNYCITLSTHTHDLEGKNYMGNMEHEAFVASRAVLHF